MKQYRCTDAVGRKRRRTNLAWALLLVLTLAALASCGSAQADKQLVTVTHVVAQGETLWEIGAKYLTPDRYILEFIEGIYELNYERVFRERERKGVLRKTVFPGDILEIRYWQ